MYKSILVSFVAKNICSGFLIYSLNYAFGIRQGKKCSNFSLYKVYLEKHNAPPDFTYAVHLSFYGKIMFIYAVFYITQSLQEHIPSIDKKNPHTVYHMFISSVMVLREAV